MKLILKGCPRCHGDLIPTDVGLQCLQCGHERGPDDPEVYLQRVHTPPTTVPRYALHGVQKHTTGWHDPDYEPWTREG